MKTPFGRTGLIGLAIGSTAGLVVVALIIYRRIIRRKSHRVVLEPRPAPRLVDTESEETLVQQTLNDETLNEMEAQQHALAAVEAVVQGLSPEQQIELRNQLDQVLSCVDLLRSEVAELRGGLQEIALQIVQDVKKGVEESQQVRRRRHVPRERTDSTSSSSIYFTCSQGMSSTYEETSEAGYSTAYAESDYTDHETDREEAVHETEEESEEEEDRSCATVLNLHQEDYQEELEERSLVDNDDAGKLQLAIEVPNGELALLLAQSDILHTGDARLKAEGFQLLLDNRTEYGDSREFLWRMARAYVDMYKSIEDKQEKKTYAQQGLEEAELALKKNGLDVECHKWFAVLTGLTSKHESIDGKLKSSHILKGDCNTLQQSIRYQNKSSMHAMAKLYRWLYLVLYSSQAGKFQQQYRGTRHT
ncbi:regulator of microtubule dynamics protein 3 isoform X2 [Parambassis ranga]|uniref:Regulator of microtubule dynamics protein 3 isoform X2 n=1 Tax=Parambassis ranga TaxID=210632 RepID=A0A6P7HPH6_9TELE|nr:regulator of microtubule dynamics protein 3-like isoform X2 [Parambassis ranga]